MKILTAIVKTILSMVFIGFCACIACLIMIFVAPNNAVQAIDVLKNLFL